MTNLKHGEIINEIHDGVSPMITTASNLFIFTSTVTNFDTSIL